MGSRRTYIRGWRDVAAVVLTLVGMWAVVATSEEDPVIFSNSEAGEFDISAGSTVQLVFDLSADAAALAIERPIEFRLALSERNGTGEVEHLQGGIIDHLPVGPITDGSSLSCICAGPELVVELQLPPDSPVPFATIDWRAEAVINLGDDDDSSGTLGLSLRSGGDAALAELAAVRFTLANFEASAVDVELVDDEQLWLQGITRHAGGLRVVAPDGHHFEVLTNQTVPLDCATGPCSGRFLLVSPIDPYGQQSEWRIVGEPETESTATARNVDLLRVRTRVADIGNVALGSGDPRTWTVDIRTAGLVDSQIDPFVFVRMTDTAGQAEQVEVVTPLRGQTDSDVSEGIGIFLPAVDGSFEGVGTKVNLTMRTRDDGPFDVDPVVIVDVFWLPADPEQADTVELIVDVDLVEAN